MTRRVYFDCFYLFLEKFPEEPEVPELGVGLPTFPTFPTLPVLPEELLAAAFLIFFFIINL